MTDAEKHIAAVQALAHLFSIDRREPLRRSDAEKHIAENQPYAHLFTIDRRELLRRYENGRKR